MIEGVQIKSLTTHTDERGHFRELIRSTDDFFAEGFGQWSESEMYTGIIKAWHVHQQQVDWWHVSEGVARAVLCDLRDVDLDKWLWEKDNLEKWNKLKFSEYFLGGANNPIILKIPPGIAHGLKILQGPAKLHYITSKVYNPDDEGRIPFDALGYDWDKRDIR